MIPDYAAELELLLSEPFAAAERRGHEAFAIAAAPRTDIVLFGAGNLGRKLLTALRARGGDRVCCLADNNSALWGRTVDGVEVLQPSVAAERYGSSAVFVVSIWNFAHSFVNTRSHLRLLGCQRVLPGHLLMCALGGELLPHYSLDMPSKLIVAGSAARRGLDLWADDQSRAFYVASVRARLEMSPETLPPPRDHYPVELLHPTPNDVFVDCGAYDGDTIVDFLRRREGAFGRIVGIEPDPGNFRRLEETVGELDSRARAKVTLVNAAAAERRCTAQLVATGTMASALADQSTLGPQATIAVECAPLDEILSGVTPTLVKVDVEGAELSALTGARGLIGRANTTWAVTTEHRLDDLWTIPAHFRSISDDYDLYLRPHGYEGWDLVCYAVPR